MGYGRRELGEGAEGSGEAGDRRLEGGRGGGDPEFRWISAALGRPAREGRNGSRGNGQSPLRIYV